MASLDGGAGDCVQTGILNNVNFSKKQGAFAARDAGFDVSFVSLNVFPKGNW